MRLQCDPDAMRAEPIEIAELAAAAAEDQRDPDRRGKNSVSAARDAAFSAARIAAKVAALGKEITWAYNGRRLDGVITLDRA